MSRTYVGRRHLGTGQVEVFGPAGISPLDDGWVDPAHGFGWGGETRGALALAHAMLADIFGLEATEGLAVTFAADVIGQLPAEGFALGEDEIRRWLNPPPNASPRLTPPGLVEHLGSVAIASKEDEALLLSRIVERCWDERTMRQ